MLDLFGARLDDYAVQTEDGRYRRTRQPLTPDVLARHLRGEETCGAYVLDENGMGLWTLVDLDAMEREWLERLFNAGVALGIRPDAMLREFSGSKGYHLWVFMAEKTPGPQLQKIGQIIVERSGVPRTDSRYLHPSGQPRVLIEIYPKTTDMSATPESMGQLVKLPLGIHRKTGQLAMPLDVTGPVAPLTPAEVDQVLAPWANVEFLQTGGAASAAPPLPGTAKHTPYPCTESMLGSTWGEGGRNSVVFLLAKRLHVAGYSLDEAIDYISRWASDHLQPNLSAREIRSTVRSGFNYTSMDCLNPDVVPHCKVSCPIYAREHPATAVGGNGVGPRLKVTTSEPPVFALPLSRGVVEVSAEDLNNWERIRVCAMEQLHVWLPRRRPSDWDRELEPLLAQVETVAAPEEVSLSGVIRVLLRQWLGRASDDPDYVDRRSVWRDTEEDVYVFRADAFIRSVLNMERQAPRMLIWEVVREAGGQQRRRTLPGSAQEIDVWEVPIR